MVSDGIGKTLSLSVFSLNPCSNGIWSLTRYYGKRIEDYVSLNPCSNGIWSLTVAEAEAKAQAGWVLILVLMEYGL